MLKEMNKIEGIKLLPERLLNRAFIKWCEKGRPEDMKVEYHYLFGWTLVKKNPIYIDDVVVIIGM